jgi:hypothetical protein
MRSRTRPAPRPLSIYLSNISIYLSIYLSLRLYFYVSLFPLRCCCPCASPQVAAGVSDWIVQGNHIGSVFAGQTQSNTAFGVQVAAGASTAFVVSANTLTGNMNGSVADASTGTSKVVANNVP